MWIIIDSKSIQLSIRLNQLCHLNAIWFRRHSIPVWPDSTGIQLNSSLIYTKHNFLTFVTNSAIPSMTLGRGYTHFSLSFTFFFTWPPKTVKNLRSHTNNISTPPKISLFDSNPGALFTIFHFGRNWGVVSGGRQGGSQLCKTPRNPFSGFLFVGKDIYLGRMFEEKWWFSCCQVDLIILIVLIVENVNVLWREA